MATTKTDPRGAGFFIVSEYEDQVFTRTVGTVASGDNAAAGEVLALAKSTAVAADAGNTGDAVLTAVTVTLGAQSHVGVYTLTCIDASTANAEVFSVIAPNGERLADLTAGVAYSGPHVALTLPNDGGTDWAADDIVTLTVTAAIKYTEAVQADVAAGASIALAVEAIDATSADATGDVLVRGPAVVRFADLTYAADINTDAEKTALKDALLAVNILARD